LGTTISSTNKTDHHDIAKILLKVALNIKTPNLVIIFLDKKFFICFAPNEVLISILNSGITFAAILH
jgi:hypothetical protein